MALILHGSPLGRENFEPNMGLSLWRQDSATGPLNRWGPLILMRVSQQLVAQHKFCATNLILNLPQALAIICHVCLNKVVFRISTSLGLLQSSQTSQQLGAQHNICAQHFKSEDQHNICAQNLKTECHQTATLALGILLLLPCLFLRSPTDHDHNRKQKLVVAMAAWRRSRGVPLILPVSDWFSAQSLLRA